MVHFTKPKYNEMSVPSGSKEMTHWVQAVLVYPWVEQREVHVVNLLVFGCYVMDFDLMDFDPICSPAKECIPW